MDELDRLDALVDELDEYQRALFLRALLQRYAADEAAELLERVAAMTRKIFLGSVGS